MNPQEQTKLPSGKTETVDETVARAKALVQPSVSANDLANPPVQPPVTPVPPPTIPDRANSTVNNVLGSIRSQSESAKRLAEEQAAFGTFADQSSGFNIQNQQLERFGVTPEKLKELEDIQLQLADRKTASELTKTRISGAAGQTIAQSQREVTQEDREAAVRDAGLAARAAVLQGNIETGRSLAKDAVDIALQDRTFKANAKLQEIKDLKDVVDEETRQMLLGEERKYNAELTAIKDLKDNIANAMVNGASQSEISKLNDPNISDAEKLSLAQSITARGANEERNLSMEAQRASIANIYDQINSRAVAAREAALKAEQEAQSKTEVEQKKREADTEQALELFGLTKQLETMSGLKAAVGTGFKKTVVGALPFVSGDAVAGTARADFEATAERVANLLTLDNLDLMSGVLSETDIKILETAGSNLRNFNQSEKQYREEIKRVNDVMQRTISNNGITPEQAVFYGVLEETDVNTFNSLWETL